MGPRKHILKILAAVLAVGFIAGVYQLLLMRFDTGDVYPPYSSLRSDPLGAKALYESLAQLPQLVVRRNFRPLGKLKPQGVTLLYLADTRGHDDANDLLNFAADGGRLVLALYAAESHDPHPLPATLEANVCVASLPAVAIANDGRWPRISWHSRNFFSGLSSQWRPLYSVANRPVIVERPWGEGSVVLMGEGYLLSNEALRKEPRPELLSHLVGSSHEVVFDETHLGVQQESGIATLARNYGLGGLLAALLMLGALAVWRLWASFIPRSAAAAAAASGESVTGRAASQGLVNLLRRSTPPRRLLELCLAQWEQANVLSEPQRRRLLPRIREIVKQDALKPPRKQDPLGAYQAICRIVAERK